MEPTRACWEGAALSAGAVALGVGAWAPSLLAGGLALAGLLLGLSWWFARAVARLSGDLVLEFEVVDGPIRRGEACELSIKASGAGSPLRVAVESPTAVGARSPEGSGDEDGRTDVCRLHADETGATGTATLTWPVAGEFAVGAPTVRVADPWGLFESAFEGDWRGERTTVRVRPLAPRDVHVGRGGRTASPGGSAVAAGSGASASTATIREYRPGDPVKHLAWKATARLGDPHVREYEDRPDVATVLVVDRGAGLAAGPPGETKLDYAREVLLTCAATARRDDQPLGLSVAGDGGVSHAQPARATRAAYRRIDRALSRLSGTTTAGRENRALRAAGERAAPVHGWRVGRSRRLADDDTAFGERLGPLFATSDPGERPEERPLTAAVRDADAGRADRAHLVLVTDDGDRPCVRGAVREARRRAGSVAVFLLPTVLFAPRDVDLGTAYGEYVAFEEFRRDLDALDGVRAFEVGPGDRLDRILAAGRDAPAAEAVR